MQTFLLVSRKRRTKTLIAIIPTINYKARGHEIVLLTRTKLSSPGINRNVHYNVVLRLVSSNQGSRFDVAFRLLPTDDKSDEEIPFFLVR